MEFKKKDRSLLHELLNSSDTKSNVSSEPEK